MKNKFVPFVLFFVNCIFVNFGVRVWRLVRRYRWWEASPGLQASLSRCDQASYKQPTLYFFNFVYFTKKENNYRQHRPTCTQDTMDDLPVAPSELSLVLSPTYTNPLPSIAFGKVYVCMINKSSVRNETKERKQKKKQKTKNKKIIFCYSLYFVVIFVFV